MSEPLQRLLRLHETEEISGLKRSAIYEGIKNKTFPAPVNLPGSAAVRWKLLDVLAWIDSLQSRHAVLPEATTAVAVEPERPITAVAPRKKQPRRARPSKPAALETA